MLSARCDHPRGSAENPLSRQQIEGKLRTYADGLLSAAHVDEVVDAVSRLEDLGSVRKLMDMLRATARHTEAGARRAAARG
jgi:2-methylcitrate dehydratase PrpD